MVDPALTASEEDLAALERALSDIETIGVDLPAMPGCTTHDVPVADGTIRVYHLKPTGISASRPTVFVSGWGSLSVDFADLYSSLYRDVEFFYIESREKRSSSIARFGADMSVVQKARDLADVISYFGLDELPDYVLYGTCWGSAIILQALIDGIINPPTCLVHDPMHTLWFPKWFLKFVAPWLPIPVLAILRPILKKTMFGDMEQPVQKARTIRFIDDAVIWKWKQAAVAARNFELYGSLGKIDTPVVVVNGTWDKVHDQSHYPRIAREIPQGRFLYMKTEECRRELLMGYVLREFALVKQADGIPQSLRGFRTI